MKLILARHGNTFAPGERAPFVGRSEDLPLVAEGEQQAKRVANRFKELAVSPELFVSSELRRTNDFARIVRDELHSSAELRIDLRLTELDFGVWSGKTNEEIEAAGYREQLSDWNNNGIWPLGVGFDPPAEDSFAQVRAFVAELGTLPPATTVFAVTSNGRLRSFALLVSGLREQLINSVGLKVRTGNLCCLEVEGATIRCRCWNQPPERYEP